MVLPHDVNVDHIITPYLMCWQVTRGIYSGGWVIHQAAKSLVVFFDKSNLW